MAIPIYSFIISFLTPNFDRIKSLSGSKSGVAYVDSFNYVKIKINSDDGLSLENTLTLHKAIILIKSVFNKNHN